RPDISGRAVVDSYWNPSQHRASDRNWIFIAWVCGIADCNSRTSGRRFAEPSNARVYPVGSGMYDSLGSVDVADLSAYGNACHAYERIVPGRNLRPRSKIVNHSEHAVTRRNSLFSSVRLCVSCGSSSFELVAISGLIAWVVLLLPVPAHAHNGPPFPIIENRKIGSCTVALWTHPDVGTVTFFVLVDPAPGSYVPEYLYDTIVV